ncbi:MAG: hypothetical protein PVI41_06470 [Roseobacter sp.]|jgi:hypothetical protein
MSDPASNTEGMDVLSSIRRLVEETKDQRALDDTAEQGDMLVLTPQLRVVETDVLRLMPEDEVTSSDEWLEFEEPPLTASEPTEDADDSDVPAFQAAADSGRVTRAVLTPNEAHLALSAKIAALETAIARTEDQWEPDGTGRDAYSGTEPPAMIWRENVDLDGNGEPMQTVSEPVKEPARVGEEHHVAEKDQYEDVIDEETLRAMVAQIVRSELQGELGERITRNVRKLVRREIQRALTTRSLD